MLIRGHARLLDQAITHFLQHGACEPVAEDYREHFETFLPVETVRETLRVGDRGTLTDEDRQAIHLFDRHAANWEPAVPS